MDTSRCDVADLGLFADLSPRQIYTRRLNSARACSSITCSNSDAATRASTSSPTPNLTKLRREKLAPECDLRVTLHPNDLGLEGSATAGQ